MDIFILLGGEDEKKRPRSNYLIKLLKTNQYDWKTLKIICSGKASFDYYIHHTEAQKMKKYLIQNNIPKQSIITEDQAMDTLGNLVFSYQIILDLIQKLKNQNEKINLHLITEKFHLKRSKFLFEKIFNSLKHNHLDIEFTFHETSEKNFIQRLIKKPIQEIKEVAFEELIAFDIAQYNLQLPNEIQNYLFSLPEYQPHYKGTMNLITSAYAKVINKYLEQRDNNSVMSKNIKKHFDNSYN